MTNLIGTNANQVPTNGMLGTMAFVDAVDSITSTATTSTTLTSTPTLLKITPASYGVAVTLPDATTCSVGGPLHIIDNKGAYPVRVLNSAGTLLGFIFAGVVSHVSLFDNSTSAGVWTVENSELVGASAQLLTANMALIDAVIDIGSSQEVIIGRGASSANCYGVVYNKSTNTFGSVTLIRTATFGSSLIAACLSGANQVLVCSVATGATSFEAVALSISGTTITVNTAATATLSANISSFADGCGLIAVGSSFVTSYTVATPAAQIRALSISGTTVTIGSATVLDGTAGGLIALGDSTHVIAVSTATTHLYTKPYLVSGSTLTAGTGTDTSRATSASLNKFAPLGTRWFIGDTNGNGEGSGSVVSLSGTGNGTTTISTPAPFLYGTVIDAIAVGSNKVLLLGNQTSSNANILTDTAGTASAGTAITLSTRTSRYCLYTIGTDVLVQDGNAANGAISRVNCSGASPVQTSTFVYASAQYLGTQLASNAVLSKSPNACVGASSMYSVNPGGGTISNFALNVVGYTASIKTNPLNGFGSGTQYRGKSDSERWLADGSSVITKWECVA